MKRLFGSVRARAALAATLVVAVALVAAGAVVLLTLRSNLTGQADSEADDAARSVATQIAQDVPYADLDLDEDHPVQVVDADRRVLAVSEGLETISGTGVRGVTPMTGGTESPDDEGDDGDDADDLRIGELGDISWHGQGWATVDGERTEYRFARIEVTDPRDRTVLVHAGASLEAERDAVRTASTVMLIGLPALLAVVGSVTWLVTRRALRPVEGIRREMAEITASEDLSRRVPEPGTHDEVARLARTTNETLSALETSVERQRRFVADASHELRSPIASLRTQLEVAAAHPEFLDLDGAVEDTVRLQRLAADLLLLARLDAGERPAGARMDLAALAGEEAEGRAGVVVRADGPVEVTGSRGQLGRVLANLLDNAARHARSAVTVTVRREGERAVLRVADDGDGVAVADRERIFERFVRLDEARSRDDGGAGLGLAIARDVAERHGGTLTVGDAPAGGALFELRLPLA
ncbi:cell wall metabolism sensor histidine kinase WalK [Streptomyces sp. YS415]|uniref:sensor histidine kinase n=1 Tax=Streptomyces sp. YS415 TaxID=2944806 RepID=UPI002021FC3A|nr:HAMP domain-containing sensor histidine kinase [Streptomyces sp. YS415]MCL7427422.1 HAMP domain-containing histidine kinase [Streptomyces sp. YS415]